LSNLHKNRKNYQQIGKNRTFHIVSIDTASAPGVQFVEILEIRWIKPKDMDGWHPNYYNLCRQSYNVIQS